MEERLRERGKRERGTQREREKDRGGREGEREINIELEQ